MVTLDDIGVNEKSIAETIVTSFSPEGEPHMAAIGVRGIGGDRLEMKIFPNTTTWENIKAKGAGVVNITRDAELIARNGLPDDFQKGVRTQELKNAKNVDAPYLQEADAIIEFEVSEIEEEVLEDKIGSSEVMIVTSEVKNIEIFESYPRAPKRAKLYLIESAVLASKAIESENKGNEESFQNFIKEIERFEKKCGKIAPKSEERQFISEMLKYLKS